MGTAIKQKLGYNNALQLPAYSDFASHRVALFSMGHFTMAYIEYADACWSRKCFRSDGPASILYENYQNELKETYLKCMNKVLNVEYKFHKYILQPEK